MPNALIEELYRQIKSIVGLDIAITDSSSAAIDSYNDHGKERYKVNGQLKRDTNYLAVEGSKNLFALPIFLDERHVGYVVVKTDPDQLALLQVSSSLIALITAQYLESNKPKPDAIDIFITRMFHRTQTVEASEVEQMLDALGYNPMARRVAVCVELHGFYQNYLHTLDDVASNKRNLIEAKKSEILKLFNSFFSRNKDNIVGYAGKDNFVVLKDLSTTNYDEFCDLVHRNYSQISSPMKNVYIKEVTLGIGLPATSALQLTASLSQAKQSLELGEKMFGQGAVYAYDDLGIMPLVISGSTEEKLEFASRIIKEDLDEEMLETLDVFLEESMNLTQTSQRLKIHRNTVIYRLDRITEVAGRDPRVFVDAVELYLALSFQRVFGVK